MTYLVQERRDYIAILRIDRQEALGALSRELLVELSDALDEIAADEAVRVVVITGTGRGFVAGADITSYDGVSEAEFAGYQALGRAVFHRFAALPQPVIAAVNGFALGGGFEIALCCDFRIASSAARFGLPEITLGLLPGGSGTQRLPRIVGAQRAAELIMTGRIFRAGEAHALGLLLREPLAPEELLPTALEFARTLAQRAPVALRAAKALLQATADAPLDEGWTQEQRTLVSLSRTPDAAEGIAAFLEKRSPVFTGTPPARP